MTSCVVRRRFARRAPRSAWASRCRWRATACGCTTAARRPCSPARRRWTPPPPGRCSCGAWRPATACASTTRGAPRRRPPRPRPARPWAPSTRVPCAFPSPRAGVPSTRAATSPPAPAGSRCCSRPPADGPLPIRWHDGLKQSDTRVKCTLTVSL